MSFLLRAMYKQWTSSFSSFNVFLMTLIVFFISGNPVNSYSWGAGSCDAGRAVGGFHLESYNASNFANGTVPNDMRCIHTGTLRRAEIDFVIDGQPVVSDTQPIQFLQFNTEYKLQVYKLTSIFRGIFIRLSKLDDSKTDLSGMLYTADPLLQMATLVCTDPTIAVGVTHKSSIDKDLVDATLRLDDSSRSSEANMTTFALEITVVGVNDFQRSMFAYSSFVIQISHGSTEQSKGQVASKTSEGEADKSDANTSDSDSSTRLSIIIGSSVLLGSFAVSLLVLRSIRRPRVQSSE